MIACIIQARMGSSRLPGKVLVDIGGRPMLAHMLDRVRRAKTLDAVIVATTTEARDDPIATWCQANGVPCHRGSETDVLDRYYRTAKAAGASVVVRLTADCPLIDPDVIDDVVRFFRQRGLDYAANTAPPEGSTFPDGMDVEVVSFRALEQAWREAKLPSEREHVTFHFWKNPERFKTARLDLADNLAKVRLTVDYPQDLEVARAILLDLARTKPRFTMRDIVAYLASHPVVAAANAHFVPNAGWTPALHADTKAKAQRKEGHG